MATTEPKVRDFTDRSRALSLEVDSGSAYELVLSLFVFGSVDEHADYEVDDDWYAGVRAQASPQLLDSLAELGDCGGIWLSLIGPVTETPSPRTVDRFIDHLSTIDPVAFRSMLFETNAKCANDIDPAAVAEVAAGSLDCLDDAVGDCDEPARRALTYLMALPVEETQRVVIDIIREFDRAAMPDRQRTAGILARDAAEKRALAESMPAEQLVEMATSGITFSAQPDIAGILLIPSVILRPWVVIWEHGPTRIFCYPVTDEHLTADPDSPPAWMVEFYKALGDEKRLRILRLLADSPMSLGDLTEQLDLSKSTVHHHVRLLRAAGLVRVTIGDEKGYSLRTDSATQASNLLEAYLAPREPVS